ncbi:hypothetical protein DERF_005050 [Dermatophagoides farinae]|uniref:Uncharacterized protein n=1 Tax=Dermatophagoides farinae TaxID=6954 RepID=A0A922I8K8_DERFA|nr:hypothetical protein DERF_005050 [Dermatophagoides farinae]
MLTEWLDTIIISSAVGAGGKPILFFPLCVPSGANRFPPIGADQMVPAGWIDGKYHGRYSLVSTIRASTIGTLPDTRLG